MTSFFLVHAKLEEVPLELESEGLGFLRGLVFFLDAQYLANLSEVDIHLLLKLLEQEIREKCPSPPLHPSFR